MTLPFEPGWSPHTVLHSPSCGNSGFEACGFPNCCRLHCCQPSCQLPDLMSPRLNLMDHANALVRTLAGASCFREETLPCQVPKPTSLSSCKPLALDSNCVLQLARTVLISSPSRCPLSQLCSPADTPWPLRVFLELARQGRLHSCLPGLQSPPTCGLALPIKKTLQEGLSPSLHGLTSCFTSCLCVLRVLFLEVCFLFVWWFCCFEQAEHKGQMQGEAKALRVPFYFFDKVFPQAFSHVANVRHVQVDAGYRI